MTLSVSKVTLSVSVVLFCPQADALAWLRTQLEDTEGKTPERERKIGSVLALMCSPEKKVRRRGLPSGAAAAESWP